MQCDMDPFILGNLANFCVTLGVVVVRRSCRGDGVIGGSIGAVDGRGAGGMVVGGA